MITAASQWTFILWAYALTAVVLAALSAWIVLDGRRRRAQLADLEARGIRRRSDTGSAPRMDGGS